MIKKILMPLVAMTVCMQAYTISDQSLKGVALSSANIAASHGADTSYYNPANMAFLPKGNLLDITMSLKAKGKKSLKAKGKMGFTQKKEVTNISNFHYIFPRHNENITFGVSLLTPINETIEWVGDKSLPLVYTKDTYVRVTELNPTMAYKLNNKFSMGIGLRLLKIQYKSDSIFIYEDKSYIFNQNEVSDKEFGYNLAMTYKPIDSTTLAITYRSKVDMQIKDELNKVSNIPLPEILSLATSYKIDDLTAELVYEFTKWASKKEETIQKNTNTYRLGLTYEVNKDLSLMTGVAFNESPMTNTRSFEDLAAGHADSRTFSLGGEYKINKNATLGLAYSLTEMDDLNIPNDVLGMIEVKNFKDSVIVFGYSYKF